MKTYKILRRLSLQFDYEYMKLGIDQGQCLEVTETDLKYNDTIKSLLANNALIVQEIETPVEVAPIATSNVVREVTLTKKSK